MFQINCKGKEMVYFLLPSQAKPSQYTPNFTFSFTVLVTHKTPFLARAPEKAFFVSTGGVCPPAGGGVGGGVVSGFTFGGFSVCNLNP